MLRSLSQRAIAVLKELQEIARDMLSPHGGATPPHNWAGNASPSAKPDGTHRNEGYPLPALRTPAFKSAVIDDRGDRVRTAFDHAAPRNPKIASAPGGRK